MQTLAPTAVTLGNLSGSAADIDESPDSPDGNWCARPEPLTGIVFPSNGTSNPVAFEFAGSGNYPDIVPLTVMVKHYPVQQTGYYVTYFHSRTDGSFGGDPYFGCHPYPQGGASGTVHNWEISIEGTDIITDVNANSTVVTKSAWYSQAASSRASGGQTIVDFYWDLDTASTRRISYTTTGGALTNAVNDPGVIFGFAPWAPTSENLSGRLRGIQIYSSQLSEADIEALHVCETNAAVLSVCSARSITSLWYLNMNPTPDDITDKSGNGNDPAWRNANRPTLWEE